MRPTVGWQHIAGERPARVIAEERTDRRGVVYLRWRQGGNWRVASTGLAIRNAKGDLMPRKVAKVQQMAAEKVTAMQMGLGLAEDAPLTILQGLARAIDPQRGLYPDDTMHRREVERELKRAAAVWNNATWNSRKPSDITALYRERYRELQREGHTGHRGAEITVQRVLAVASWLRGEEAIAMGACHAAKDWKRKLADELKNPEPARPRHTISELRAILAAAPRVDPRLALLLELGAEQRLGQVVRLRRNDLDLEGGTMLIRGAGKKSGGRIVLTPGQIAHLTAALSGYLAPLTGNFPLFPEGLLQGARDAEGHYVDRSIATCFPVQSTAKPASGTAIRKWFARAEELAGVPHLEGRGPYGLRRQGVDAAKEFGISREGLKAHGGWSSTQVPDTIYAEQDARYASEEAARIRAQIRGEPPVGYAETVTNMKDNTTTTPVGTV